MVKFINVDALTLLSEIEDNSIDYVLIDPPYTISRETGFASGNNKNYDRLKVSMDFGEWDNTFTNKELSIIIKECYRVLNKGGYITCFYDLWKITDLKNILENNNFKQIRFIEWIKTNPVPLNQRINYLTNAREIALCGVKHSKARFNSKYHNGIYKAPIEHSKDRFHPTQKPLSLIKELIEIHSKPGDTVLDVFSGSGTTAVASVLLDRKFIGCEKDKNIFKKASKRIKKYDI